MPRLNSIRAFVDLLCAALPATPLSAEDYPSKPIRILAGAAPGGLIDLFARTFAQRLQERSGQPVVVENNSVATGTIGADHRGEVAARRIHAAAGPPRQHNDLAADQSQIALQSREGFRSRRARGAGRQPAAGIEKLAHPFRAGVDATAKAQPGTLTYASQGVGSSAHMAPSSSSSSPGRPDPRPLRGSTTGDTDLIGGQVSLIIDTVRSTSRRCARARCARWPSPPIPAPQCCRTFRPWPRRACPACRVDCGSRCLLPPIPRPRLLPI